MLGPILFNLVQQRIITRKAANALWKIYATREAAEQKLSTQDSVQDNLKKTVKVLHEMILNRTELIDHTLNMIVSNSIQPTMPDGQPLQYINGQIEYHDSAMPYYLLTLNFRNVRLIQAQYFIKDQQWQVNAATNSKTPHWIEPALRNIQDASVLTIPNNEN